MAVIDTDVPVYLAVCHSSNRWGNPRTANTTISYNCDAHSSLWLTSFILIHLFCSNSWRFRLLAFVKTVNLHYSHILLLSLTAVQEQDKSSDIEQQPPFGDRKISNIQPQNRGGLQNQQEHHIIVLLCVVSQWRYSAKPHRWRCASTLESTIWAKY